MSSAKVKHGNAQFDFKVPKRGDRFVFLYLGLDRNGGEPLDPEQQLRKLGWVPADEAG